MTVEKFEDGSWSETSDLNETQMSQINWYFIKNNDEQDTDVLTDNPTDDTISIDGLEMSVTINEENIYQYGHAHAFVVDSDVENGHAVSELVRAIEVIEITESYINEEEAECNAIVNIENPSAEEIAQIRWNINDKEINEYNGKETITHNLKEEKVKDIMVKAYVDSKPEKAAFIALVYDTDVDKDIELEKDEDNK